MMTFGLIAIVASGITIACSPNTRPLPRPSTIALAPYSFPIWASGGDALLYGYVPLISVNYNRATGEVQYVFADSIAGTWRFNSGTTPQRVTSFFMSDPDASDRLIIFERGARIYTMPLSNGAPDTTLIALLKLPGRVFEPRLSDSGDSVLFRRGDFMPGLWTSAVDGSGAHLAVPGALQGDFSDDTSVVYIQHSAGGGIGGIFSLVEATAQGVGPRVLYSTATGQIRALKCSPDGLQVVFSFQPGFEGDSDLWLIGRDGTGLRRLTTVGIGDDFSWHPSGTDVTFVRYQLYSYDRINGTLWSVAVSTGALRQLTFN